MTNNDIPEIKFDSSVVFEIAETNTSPQFPIGTPITKSVPIIGLAYSPTPTKTATATPTPATKTPTPTPTLTPTNTVTRTQTPTVTITSTVTKTVTPTPTKTTTPTVTVTPSPTVTTTSTLTPTPSRGCLIGDSYFSYDLPASAQWNASIYDTDLNIYTIIENQNANLYGSVLSDLAVTSGLPLSGPNYWKSIASKSGIFSVVGASPTGAYSTDGLSWSLGSGMPTTSGLSYTWNQIIYAEEIDKFIAVPSISSISGVSKIAYSSDGISWSGVNLPYTKASNGSSNISKDYLTLAYGNNNTLVLGSNAVNEFSYTGSAFSAGFLVSTNGGTVWTERKPITNEIISNANYIGSITKIVYGNDMFVAITDGIIEAVDGFRIFYSSTGIDWNLALTVAGSDAGLVFGTVTSSESSKFILVVNNISSSKYSIYHSPDGKWWYSSGAQITLSGGIQSIFTRDRDIGIVSTNNVFVSLPCSGTIGY